MKAFLAALALSGCATEAPQGRYLSAGTTPVCVFACVVTTTSTEAAQFPALRQAREATGASKSTTTAATTNVGGF